MTESVSTKITANLKNCSVIKIVNKCICTREVIYYNDIYLNQCLECTLFKHPIINLTPTIDKSIRLLQSIFKLCDNDDLINIVTSFIYKQTPSTQFIHINNSLRTLDSTQLHRIHKTPAVYKFILYNYPITLKRLVLCRCRRMSVDGCDEVQLCPVGCGLSYSMYHGMSSEMQIFYQEIIREISTSIVNSVDTITPAVGVRKLTEILVNIPNGVKYLRTLVHSYIVSISDADPAHTKESILRKYFDNVDESLPHMIRSIHAKYIHLFPSEYQLIEELFSSKILSINNYKVIVKLISSGVNMREIGYFNQNFNIPLYSKHLFNCVLDGQFKCVNTFRCLVQQLNCTPPVQLFKHMKFSSEFIITTSLNILLDTRLIPRDSTYLKNLTRCLIQINHLCTLKLVLQIAKYDESQCVNILTMLNEFDRNNISPFIIELVNRNIIINNTRLMLRTLYSSHDYITVEAVNKLYTSSKLLVIRFIHTLLRDKPYNIIYTKFKHIIDVNLRLLKIFVNKALQLNRFVHFILMMNVRDGEVLLNRLPPLVVVNAIQASVCDYLHEVCTPVSTPFNVIMVDTGENTLNILTIKSRVLRVINLIPNKIKHSSEYLSLLIRVIVADNRLNNNHALKVVLFEELSTYHPLKNMLLTELFIVNPSSSVWVETIIDSSVALNGSQTCMICLDDIKHVRLDFHKCIINTTPTHPSGVCSKCVKYLVGTCPYCRSC